MACRMKKVEFHAMALDEADRLRLRQIEVTQADPVEAFSMVEVDEGTAVLNRKAIQSIVDHPEEARPIIRNLLRWAKEHGAK